VAVLAAVALLLGGVVAICLVWRFAALPCPWWMVPLLENPYFQIVAGAELLMDRAGIGPGMAVLDAGCGPGRLTVPIAKRVGEAGRVVAVDRQPRMLRQLQRRLADRAITNVETILGGLGEGRLPADRFDVVLLVTVLGEIPDKAAALREIRHALRSGGVLSVTVVLPDPHYQTLAQVRALAAEAGLAEQRLFEGRGRLHAQPASRDRDVGG
jgi:ubiquinone/menaquinone biosynthesis C-methylase UbiE